MKRFLLIIITSALLSGCSTGITQEDYDILNNQYETLKTDNNTTELAKKELQEKYDELLKEYDIIQSESLIDYYETFSESNVNIVIESWGITAFGDSTKCFQKSNQTIEYETEIQNVTQDNILQFFKQLDENMGTLALVTSYEDIKNISIKVNDTDKNPIFELYLHVDNVNQETQIMINTDYTDLVKNAIMTAY